MEYSTSTKRLKVDLDQPVGAEQTSDCQHYLFTLLKPLTDTYESSVYRHRPLRKSIKLASAEIDKLKRLLSQPGFLESVCLERERTIPTLEELITYSFEAFDDKRDTTNWDHYPDFKPILYGLVNLISTYSYYQDNYSGIPRHNENYEDICDIIATLFWNTGYVKTIEDVARLKRVYEQHPNHIDVRVRSPIDAAPAYRGQGRFWKCISDKIERKIKRARIQDELLEVSRVARRSEGTSQMRVPKDIERHIQSYINAPSREAEFLSITPMPPSENITITITFNDTNRTNAGMFRVHRDTTLGYLYDLVRRRYPVYTRGYNRIIYKGRTYPKDSQMTLRELDTIDGSAITLIG